MQPDSLIPDPSNPQAWNRYSYVSNNPIRNIDPTGHKCVGNLGECFNVDNKTAKGFTGDDHKPAAKGCGSVGQIRCNGKSPSYGAGLVGPSRPYGPPVPQDYYETHPSQPIHVTNPIDSYCADSSSGTACLANLAQDVATLTDLVGVGLIEGPAVIAGCLDGGPFGCAIAEVGVWAIWTLTLNNVETAASTTSLVLTIIDDANNHSGWGENSSTSLATWGAGVFAPTPSLDFAVDTYASAYNHGFFNGIDEILPNGVFK